MIAEAKRAMAKRLCRALALVLGVDMTSYDAMVKKIEAASPDERARMSREHLDTIRRTLD